MAIAGAIFDCDGTLLDSMPMWTDACVGLLQRHGVADAARVFAEQESLDMHAKCVWYHEHLGIGASAEELYRELWRTVEHAYRTRVRAIAGARAFLDTLHDADIPLAIASATPTVLLTQALADHGMDTYFDRIVFAGDVGRGKEHPDVYLAACERLGTPRERTWVFEDAPFGVRSAARAGFPTVAIMNEHDGRDTDFMRRWATVACPSFEGLDLQLLEASEPRVLRALVVAGSPEPSSPNLVARLASASDYVIAADRGARSLMAADVAPDLLCGDEDSADPTAIAWAHDSAARIERHPREKDDTDLGLAILCARNEAERRGAALRLTVTCASGGRPDHALGVWGLLARHADIAPRLVEDGFECRVLSPGGEPSWELADRVGTTFSAIALAPDTVASEKGMRWELNRAPLEPLDDVGVSNRIVDERARVICHAGVLAAFVLRG